MALGKPAQHRIEMLCEGDCPIAYFWLNLASVSDARLLDIYVFPAKRGKGLGQLVMDRILTVLRERSVARFTLTVSSDNSAARALYDRHGAKVLEQTDGLVVLWLPVAGSISH